MGEHQHYVPRFLLRAFGHGSRRSRRIFVFDKRDGTVTERSVKNVAAETKFYDLKSIEHSLDPLLTELEDEAARIIRYTSEKESLRLLSTAQRHSVAFFLAVQMTRTLNVRQDLFRQREVTGRILEKRGVPPSEIERLLGPEANHDEFVKLIASTAPKLVPHLLDKVWTLFRAPGSHPLYVGDNPVTKENLFPAPPFKGNLGLAQLGIIVHLPLRPDLSLTLACSAIGKEIALRDPKFALAAERGRPVPMVPANVDRENSLQVINAERYVYSCNADFSLAIDMITKDPQLREGPRTLVCHPDGDPHPMST